MPLHKLPVLLFQLVEVTIQGAMQSHLLAQQKHYVVIQMELLGESDALDSTTLAYTRTILWHLKHYWLCWTRIHSNSSNGT